MAPCREWTLTRLALYQGLVWKNIMLQEKTFTIPLKKKKNKSNTKQTRFVISRERKKDVFSTNSQFFGRSLIRLKEHGLYLIICKIHLYIN